MRNATRILLVVALLLGLAVSPVAAQGEGEFQCDTWVPGVCAVAEAIHNVLSWIGNLIGAIWDWIQGAINWIVTAVSNIIRFIIAIIEGIWNFALTVVQFIAGVVNAIIQFISEAVAVVTLAINIVITLIVAVATFVFEVVGAFLQLIGSYYDAGATPVPGIPLCISDPTSYDLCAFWYVADYTVLAPGTIGALIPTVSLIILDIIIIFFVVRMVFRFAREVEEMFSGA